jgi:predicted nucleic acid-binding protein
MCPISYYEVKRGFIRHNSTTKLAEFVDGFIPLCPVGDVDRAMLDRACEIYSDLTKEGRIIEDADILIAAFCIANGYTLVTDNTKHFERIPTLEVANWAEK